MIASLPTQTDVDRVVEGSLRPDVVRIRMDVGRDWTDDPSIEFRIILTDEAAGRRGHLAEISERVMDALFEGLRLSEVEHIPYFTYRSESEQAELQDPAWV